MSVHLFGRLADGTEISEIRLATAAGATASVITLGASVRDLVVPLTGGSGRRVVLGFPTLEGYLANPGYIGVTAGRHASRIGRGLLPIGGVRYQLTLNDGGRHHLHGGTTGFSRRPWRILAEDAVSVTLGLTSPDGDQGYPGTVEARCTYRLEEPATLRVVMTATADAPTAVSLAHHSYFTLSPRRSIRDHRLAVNARHYTPLDAERIPTGEISGGCRHGIRLSCAPADFQSRAGRGFPLRLQSCPRSRRRPARLGSHAAGAGRKPANGRPHRRALPGVL